MPTFTLWRVCLIHESNLELGLLDNIVTMAVLAKDVAAAVTEAHKLFAGGPILADAMVPIMVELVAPARYTQWIPRMSYPDIIKSVDALLNEIETHPRSDRLSDAAEACRATLNELRRLNLKKTDEKPL